MKHNNIRSLIAGVGLGIVVIGACGASLFTTRQAQTAGSTSPVPMEPSNGSSDSFARVDHTHDLNSAGCPNGGVWQWTGAAWLCASTGVTFPTCTPGQVLTYNGELICTDPGGLPACVSGEYPVKRGLGWYCEGALPRPWLCAEGKYLRVADGGWVCQEGYSSLGAQVPLDIVGVNPTTSANPIIKLNECPNGFRWSHRDDGWWCEPSLNQIVAVGNGVVVTTPPADGGNELDYATATVGLRMCPADQVLVATPPDAGGPNVFSYTCQNVVNSVTLADGRGVINTNLTAQNQGRMTIGLVDCSSDQILQWYDSIPLGHPGAPGPGWSCAPGMSELGVEFPLERAQDGTIRLRTMPPGYVLTSIGDAGGNPPWMGEYIGAIAIPAMLDCPGGYVPVRPAGGGSWYCAKPTINSSTLTVSESPYLNFTVDIPDTGHGHVITTCGPGEVYVGRDAGLGVCVRTPSIYDPPQTYIPNANFFHTAGPVLGTLQEIQNILVGQSTALSLRYYLSGGAWYVEISADLGAGYVVLGSSALPNAGGWNYVNLCPLNARLCQSTLAVVRDWDASKDGATYSVYISPSYNSTPSILPVCEPGEYLLANNTLGFVCDQPIETKAIAASAGGTCDNGVLFYDEGPGEWKCIRVNPLGAGCPDGQALIYSEGAWSCGEAGSGMPSCGLGSLAHVTDAGWTCLGTSSDMSETDEWVADLDCDFSTQANQTLSANQTYTVCGATWTKINSANETSPMAVVNGTGLVIRPAQNTDFWTGTRSLPGIYVKFTDLVPGFDHDTPVRVWTYVSGANPSGNYDGVDTVVENRVSGTRARLNPRGYYNGSGPYSDYHWYGNTAGQNYKSGAPWNTYDVARISAPLGLIQNRFNLEVGAWNLGWPTPSALVDMSVVYSWNNLLDTSAQGVLSDWDFLIGAHRAGSGTDFTATIKRVKVEHKRRSSSTTVYAGGLPPCGQLQHLEAHDGGWSCVNQPAIPADISASSFVTASSEAALSNERVLSNGTNTTIDTGTAGQIKVNLSGTVPQSLGGTGSGALTCTTGQALVSNGTSYACTSTLYASDVQCSGQCVADSEIVGVSGSKVGGAVATATALAADPTDCTAGQYANAIASSGNLTCSAVTLNQVANPTADKLFQMSSRNLVFSWTNPTGADGAFELEANGNYSGDLLHVHQHTGNPNAGTDLIHAEASSANVLPLRVTASSASAQAATITGKVSASEFVGPLNGNASTATALASNPTDCTSNQYATAISANGNLTCAQVSYGQISGTPTIPADISGSSFITAASEAGLSNERVLSNGTNTTVDTANAGQIKVNVTGNVPSATALAANPTDCPSDQYAMAIDEYGNLTCAPLTTLATNTQLDSCPEGQILVKRPHDSTADAGNAWACAAQPTTYNSSYSPVLLTADLNRVTGRETISADLRACGEGEHLSTTMVNDAGVWYCVKDYTEPTCGPGEVYVGRDAGVSTCVRTPNPEDPPYSVFNSRFTWVTGPVVNTNLFNLWDVGIKEEVAVKFRHYLSGGVWYVEIFWAPGTNPTAWTSVGSEALSSSEASVIPLCPKNVNMCNITYVVLANLFTPDKDGTTYSIFAQPSWNTYSRMLPICDTPGQYMVWSTQQQRLVCQQGVPEAALANSAGSTSVLLWNQPMEEWQMVTSVPSADWSNTSGYADEAGTTEMLLNPPITCSIGYCAGGIDQWGNADNCVLPASYNAQYWTGAADSTLSAEKNLGALGTGLVINTAGTPSILTQQTCTNQFVRSYNASGTASCASVNLSTDTAATALPATKGGTGKTTTSYGGVLYGDTGNVFNWAVAGNQAQGLFGSSSGGGLPSFQDSFLRSYRNTTWTNSTTSNTAIFTFTIAGSGYHYIDCTIPVLCTATSCPQLSFGGGAYDSTGYFTVRSHRTAATPNWDHVSLDTLSTACTTGCYTSFTNWHIEGSFFEAAGDTVYLYGRSSTAGQTVSVYAGATCKWN